MKFSYNPIIITLASAGLSFAHVEMQQPAPRKSQFNKGYGSAPDYDMNSPLGAFPCKGYGKGPSVQTVNAGNSIAVKLLGEASHNGGHCQFSLSYDNGKTFVVIKTILGECLRKDGYDYSVQIPSNAPNGDAIFAWSWVNRTGNREFYMNCADITVNGSSSNSLSGPQLLVANLPGYPTIPEFTDGGYDGSDLYGKCPSVTVTGSGSGSNQNQTNESSYKGEANASQSKYTPKQTNEGSYKGEADASQSKYTPKQNNYSKDIAQENKAYAPSKKYNPTPVYGKENINSVNYNTIAYPSAYNNAN